jgi:hypothetical protein
MNVFWLDHQGYEREPVVVSFTGSAAMSTGHVYGDTRKFSRSQRRLPMIATRLLACALTLAATDVLPAQQTTAPPGAAFTFQEVMIPVRDGVHLRSRFPQGPQVDGAGSIDLVPDHRSQSAEVRAQYLRGEGE